MSSVVNDYLNATYLPALADKVNDFLADNKTPPKELLETFVALSQLNPGGQAADYPSIIATPWNPYPLAGTGASTALNTTEIDWSLAPYAGVDAFRISARTQANGTAVGANATFTINYTWADTAIANFSEGLTVPLIAADRRTSVTKTLPNVSNAEANGGGLRTWEISDILLPKARYLYLSVDKSAFASGASVDLTLRLTRVV